MRHGAEQHQPPQPLRPVECDPGRRGPAQRMRHQHEALGHDLIEPLQQDIGLPRPPVQDINELAQEISPERINEADADWIFYSSYGPPEATDQGAVVGGQLWAELPGVKSGHVRPVDDEVWFLGLGPTGAMLVLDDLEKILATP